MRAVFVKSAFAPWREPRSYRAVLDPHWRACDFDYVIRSVRFRTMTMATTMTKIGGGGGRAWAFVARTDVSAHSAGEGAAGVGGSGTHAERAGAAGQCALREMGPFDEQRPGVARIDDFFGVECLRRAER